MFSAARIATTGKRLDRAVLEGEDDLAVVGEAELASGTPLRHARPRAWPHLRHTHPELGATSWNFAT
jgi:hypothetical protein